MVINRAKINFITNKLTSPSLVLVQYFPPATCEGFKTGCRYTRGKEKLFLLTIVGGWANQIEKNMLVQLDRISPQIGVNNYTKNVS